MRFWVIAVLSCGLLYMGYKYLEAVKFDTTVSVSVSKGPFKGLSLKLIDYQVSYSDLHVKNDFWESKPGKALFNKLSTTLQTLVLASKQYVDVQFDVNYLGIIRRHYKVIQIDGEFDLVSI